MRASGVPVVVLAPDRGMRSVMGSDAMDPGRRRAVAEHVHEVMSDHLAAGTGPAHELADLW